ncbi:MAG: hypothetical protein HY704_09775 [Gemmatimonadetes bacterium]|nr:hypothetical protein [Gemmatimonadota bacterium]
MWLLVLGASPPVRAQQCPGGRISHIFIDNHSIFDTSDPSLHERLRWAYELANRLHVSTRPEFIARELLFGEGDCFNELRLQESERILRGYPFISQVDVFPVEQDDGTRHVVVDTHDEWSTKIDLRVAFEDGLRFDGLEITEENVAGTGQATTVFYRERKEVRDFGLSWSTPQLLATRWDAQLIFGETRVGTLFEQGILYPFVGELGRWAFRERYRRHELFFAYALDARRHGRLSHALLSLERRSLDLTLAARIGRPGNLTILGAGIGHERLGFPGFPGSARVVVNGEFDRTEPASMPVLAAMADQATEVSGTRVNLVLGQRNLRFVRRRGLDALAAVEDVPLGTEIEATLGRTIGSLSDATISSADDLFARGRIFIAFEPGDLLVASNLWVEGRRPFAGEGSGRWRDVLGQMDSFLYWRPPGLARHMLFARVSGSGGWAMTTPFQLTLGGRTALRGFDEDRFPGARRLVFTLEDRMALDGLLAHLMDLGAALFVEGGAAWAGDAPFSVDSGVQAALGAGIRGAFPQGSQRVFRIDVTAPITGGPAFREVIVRMSFEELLGLAAGFRDPQIERSRLRGVSAELLNFPK